MWSGVITASAAYAPGYPYILQATGLKGQEIHAIWEREKAQPGQAATTEHMQRTSQRNELMDTDDVALVYREYEGHILFIPRTHARYRHPSLS